MAFFGTIFLITRGQRHADAWIRAVARRVPAVKPDTSRRSEQGRRPHHAAGQQPPHALVGLHVGHAQLALGRRVPVGLLWSFGHVISPIDLLVAYGLANVLAAIRSPRAVSASSRAS
jgi:hypothetical protein